VRYASVVTSLRQVAKRVVPAGALDAYRRRRSLRRYLKSIAYEVYDRNRTFELEELEGELLARRPDITSRLMKDLLMRTDILIQQLDRQVEALRVRHGGELRKLRAEIGALRTSLEALRSEIEIHPKASTTAPAEETAAQSPAGSSLSGD
jgi:hypothetical protein